MTPRPELIYVFDPLCGWCYGASPAANAAVESGSVDVRALPSGLFAWEGGRPMTADFASYAWSNDQRIARLTGQPFTETYRESVLNDTTRRFDSGPATEAFALVEEKRPRKGLRYLAKVQHARYADGRDVIDPALLAEIASGEGLDADAFYSDLASGRGKTLAQPLVAAAREVMRGFGASGVPFAVLKTAAGARPLPTQVLLDRGKTLLALIEQSATQSHQAH